MCLIYDATELGRAKLCRDSDVSMESGSTSGAVSVCKPFINGVGKACGLLQMGLFLYTVHFCFCGGEGGG